MADSDSNFEFKLWGLGSLKRSLIRSWIGGIIHTAAVSVIVVSFYGFADRAESVFSPGSGPGVDLIGTGSGAFPSDWSYPLLGGLILIIFGYTTLTYFMRWLNQLWFNSYLPTFLGISIFGTAGTLLILEFGFIGVEMSSDNSLFLPIRIVGVLALNIVIGLIGWRYSGSLLNVDLRNHDNVHLYIENQWRFAQMSMTLGLAAAIGTSFPFVFDFASNFGVMPLLFLFGFLLTPIIVFGLFFVMRLYAIERFSRKHRIGTESEP